jgi:hypothetical protein
MASAKMQKRLFLISSATLFVVLIALACAEQELTICERYCDLSINAAIQDARDQLCEPYQSDLDRFEASCASSCYEVLEYVVDKSEKKDAEDCLKCIVEKTTTPREHNIDIAEETCFKVCNTLGGYQFFYSFYVFPPWWDCE